jgi:radical S-adenosyl methionine domain-containing protein 2
VICIELPLLRDSGDVARGCGTSLSAKSEGACVAKSVEPREMARATAARGSARAAASSSSVGTTSGGGEKSAGHGTLEASDSRAEMRPEAPSASRGARPGAAFATSTPLALNIHFTRQCNYACGFCFHTQTNVSRLPPRVWASAMPNFKRAGVSKVNFAGGEPFLFPEELGEMVRAARAAGLTTSVITNMSCANKVDAWFGVYGSSLSMLGVSFDSGSDFINHTHGRWPKGGGAPDPARRAAGGVSLAVKNLRIHAEACRKHSVPLKINTVVTARNADEDLFEVINEVKPVRWKVFQVLELEGENAGACALSNVAPLLISSEKFRAYCDRNQRGLIRELQGIMKREGNATMQSS